jgi:hypothetical protein
MAPVVMRVCFQHSIGWDFRYLIARVTGRPVHVATDYDGALYEAAFSGMRCVNASARLSVGDWEVFDVPGGCDAAAALTLAQSRVGWPYDWLGAMYGWWLGRPAGDVRKHAVYCSETAAGELHAAQFPLRYSRAAHYTPRSLRDELAHVHGLPSWWIRNGERAP